MKGPIGVARSGIMEGYENLGPFYEWAEAGAYLMIDRVRFRDKAGAILCYYNPPVHQVGNPGLDAYLEGLDQVFKEKDRFEYLILYGANDPVHAGGDLKESLANLDRTLEKKKEKEASGASPDEPTPPSKRAPAAQTRHDWITAPCPPSTPKIDAGPPPSTVVS